MAPASEYVIIGRAPGRIPTVHFWKDRPGRRWVGTIDEATRYESWGRANAKKTMLEESGSIEPLLVIPETLALGLMNEPRPVKATP